MFRLRPKANVSRREWDAKWIKFYWFAPETHFTITFEECGYFDPRARINLDLIWFGIRIILPLYSDMDDECDPPRWGFAIHNSSLWIYYGGHGNGTNRMKAFHFPWEWVWVKAFYKSYEYGWVEHADSSLDLLERKAQGFLCDTVIFTYERGDIKQDRVATISVRKHQYRMRWLKWLPFFYREMERLDVDFNEETGKGAGSWKGGVTSMSCLIGKGESYMDRFSRALTEI